MPDKLIKMSGALLLLVEDRKILILSRAISKVRVSVIVGRFLLLLLRWQLHFQPDGKWSRFWYRIVLWRWPQDRLLMSLFLIYLPSIIIQKRCSETFNCSDPFQTVHFKFDRFNTQPGHDYLTIGLPEDTDYNSLDQRISEQRTENVQDTLILEGNQEAGIWVNAESIKNFHIHFFRKTLTNILIYIFTSFLWL